MFEIQGSRFLSDSACKWAWVAYLACEDLTAEEGAKQKLRMGILHPYLKLQDRKWCNVPAELMTASSKRLHGMYNTIRYWRKQLDQVNAELAVRNRSRDSSSGDNAADLESEAEFQDDEGENEPPEDDDESW